MGQSIAIDCTAYININANIMQRNTKHNKPISKNSHGERHKTTKYYLLVPKTQIDNNINNTVLPPLQHIRDILPNFASNAIYSITNVFIFGSSNGLSPTQRQAITWTNAWPTTNQKLMNQPQ